MLLKKRREWLALVTMVCCFSIINIYFLAPTTSDKATLEGEEKDHLPLKLMLETQRRNPESSGTRSLVSTSTCPQLSLPLPLKDSQTFQPISGSTTFVYSAFLDNDIVRIIAFRKALGPRTFFCQLWSRTTEGESLFLAHGNVYTIPEGHGRTYAAAYIICQLPPILLKHPPVAVSIVFKETCSNPSNHLLVLPSSLPQPSKSLRPPLPPQPAPKYKFTVCVAPVYNYSDTNTLVEMIEFNRILGAEKLVFYNYSILPNVGKIMDYYNSLGLVDVLNWPPSLPYAAHYFGQLGALNDCLYRYRKQSLYLVYQDLDEFIVPTGKHSNWLELVESRTKLNSDIAVFQAKCTFFRKEWPQLDKDFQQNAEVRKYHSVVLANTVREFQVLPHGHRSKYIANPRLVETVGIHDAWSKTGTVDKLPENVALLYHYRDWEAPKDRKRRIQDTFVVRKYGAQLVGRLAKAWKQIEQKTGITL